MADNTTEIISQKDDEDRKPVIKPEGNSEVELQAAGSGSENLVCYQTQLAPAEAPPGVRGQKRKIDELDVIVLDRYDDVDLEVPPYQPEQEEFPRLACYHPSFKEAEMYYTGIVKQFLDAVEESDHRSEFADFIRAKVHQMKSISYPDDIIIGLRGQSGVGKSSLLNCLLGEDVVDESDSGGACTAVVQEFCQLRPHHKTQFAAEVRLIDSKLRTQFLKDCIRQSWECAQAELTPDDDDYSTYKRAAQTACESVVALFRNHKEASDAMAASNLLTGANTAEDPDILAQLMSWLEELMVKMGLENGRITFECSNLAKLKSQTEPFLRTVGSNASLWPLVSTIRTYIDNKLLKQGIVIADLPGTCDSNQLREEVSHRYIRKVDYTAVIAPIDRIESNQAVNEFIIEASRRRGIDQILVVATKTDAVTFDMTKYVTGLDEDCHAAASGNQDELSARKKLKEEQLKERKNDAKNARKRRDQAEMRRIESEQNQLKLDLAKLHSEHGRHCIHLRNKKVAKSLNDQYYGLGGRKERSSLAPQPLPVFCVSNSAYKRNLESWDVLDPPQMDATLSGIPGLRSYLYNLPAQGKFASLNYHCEDLLDGFLNEIVLSCAQDKIERKEQLVKRLHYFKDEVDDTVQDVFNDFCVDYIEPLLKVMKAKVERWIKTAEKKLAKWAEWRYSTYKSFVTHGGRWKTKRVGAHNWNKELMDIISKDLTQHFEELDRGCGKLDAELSGALSSLIDECADKLSQDAGSAQASLATFLGDLRLQRSKLSNSSTQMANRLERGIVLIKDLLFSSKDSDAYFITLTAPIYKECGHPFQGPGSGQRRIQAFNSKITHVFDGPFAKIYYTVKTSIEKVLEDEATSMKLTAIRVFDTMLDNFNRHFSIKEDDSEEGKAFRDLLLAQVPDARAVMNTELAGYLADCKNAGHRATTPEADDAPRHLRASTE